MESPSIRHRWLERMHQVAYPVIDALSRKRLKEELPLSKDSKKRGVGYLEAFGRMLLGIGPWLVSTPEDAWEKELQADYIQKIRQCIDVCTDPDSPDYFIWSKSHRRQTNQPLVDAAFFASGLLKAKAVLWDTLEERVQANVLQALRDVNKIRAGSTNNWMLFGATVDTALYILTGKCDTMKLEFTLYKMNSFYLGDGTYGDGKKFAWDYYNSYVMQPFMEEVTEKTGALFQYNAFGETLRENVVRRLQRYCEIQERLIAPDGTYVATGRSTVYRMAAFQALAHAAWRELLPPSLPEGQVRNALTKMMQNFFSAPTMFDEHGFLRAGLYGYQPAMQDSYVCTGSLYMCCAMFVPLGLDADHAFWQCADLPITWEKAWSGTDVPFDTAKD